jgi:hypothetical protein
VEILQSRFPLKEEAHKTLEYCDTMVDEFINFSLNSEESLAESVRFVSVN